MSERVQPHSLRLDAFCNLDQSNFLEKIQRERTLEYFESSFSLTWSNHIQQVRIGLLSVFCKRAVTFSMGKKVIKSELKRQMPAEEIRLRTKFSLCSLHVHPLNNVEKQNTCYNNANIRRQIPISEFIETVQRSGDELRALEWVT